MFFNKRKTQREEIISKIEKAEELWKLADKHIRNLCEGVVNEKLHYRVELKDRSVEHLDDQLEALYKRREEERKVYEQRFETLKTQLSQL